jgi:hypothetical protein
MTTRTDASRVTNTHILGSMSHIQRSTEMQTMHEALAREHMRELEQHARRNSLSRRMASANRWRHLERLAAQAHQRRVQRAHRVAEVSAVAD